MPYDDTAAQPPTYAGTVVLITGGTAGIGLACAERLHAKGATLVLVARSPTGLARCEAHFRERVHTIQADVGTDDGCRKIIDWVDNSTGNVKVLINNAGVHHRGLFRELDEGKICSMVDVNLKAPMRLAYALLPKLIESRGVIVNIASLAGCIPLAGSSAYSATKFGIRAWSMAMADELAESGVRVCCVSPGPVRTGFILDSLDSVTDMTLSQPMVTPASVADAVMSASKTGQIDVCIPVSSGRLAKLGYLLPGLRRLLSPILSKRGAKRRRRLLDEQRRR